MNHSRLNRWLTPEIESVLRKIEPKVELEYASTTCFPPEPNIFRALELVQPEQVKVVIIGQDPYHEQGQACGLAFAVPNGMKVPPSLRNIFKELENEKGIVRTKPDLSDWTAKGVLLLNTILTVRAHEAYSHKDIGWDPFVYEILRIIAQQDRKIVWLLWGTPAGKYVTVPQNPKHLVLRSVHPSPLSAHRGFFGNGHFVAAEKWLEEEIFI